MDVLFSPSSQKFLVFIALFTAFVLLIVLMFKLVKWSRKRPKGGYLMIALLPLISIFPIPAQEVKKLEDIKKEQIREEDENDEPKDELAENQQPSDNLR